MVSKTRLVLNALHKVLLVAVSAAIDAVFGHIGSEATRRLGNGGKSKKKKKPTTKRKPAKKKSASAKKKGGKNGVPNAQTTERPPTAD